MFRPRLLSLAAAFSLAGCARGHTVVMGEQPSATAHYVIVKTKFTGKTVVFDCQSSPDGAEWEPTCRKVKMQGPMGELLDDTFDKVIRR